MKSAELVEQISKALDYFHCLATHISSHVGQRRMFGEGGQYGQDRRAPAGGLEEELSDGLQGTKRRNALHSSGGQETQSCPGRFPLASGRHRSGELSPTLTSYSRGTEGPHYSRVR